MRLLHEQFKNITYCFEVALDDGTKLFLTSGDRQIKSDSIVFIPDSALTLKEAEFNDSAQNYIILEGIYEPSGITKQMDLNEAEIKISIYLQQAFYPFVTYRSNLYTKNDLSFILHLGPETIKYNQSLLKVFSKKCRANFCDSKCMLDKNLYSQTYEISSIISRHLTLTNCDKEDGYFNEGRATFVVNNKESEFNAIILGHSRTNIELNKLVPDIVVNNSTHVILTAGCDKNFITCCNKFNNGVNFRGEPLIPEYNFLKINSIK